MSSPKFLVAPALLAIALASATASAGTISCTDSQAFYSFRQTKSDGGAPPPEELERPRWFVGGVEQPSGFNARFDLGTKDVWHIRKLSKDFQMEVSSITAVVGGFKVTMYCFAEVYVGLPRP